MGAQGPKGARLLLAVAAALLLLGACQITVSVVEPTPTPSAPLLATTLAFTSGVGPGTGRQVVPIRGLAAGRYVLTLAQANPAGDYWIVWDYIGLHRGEAALWAVGELEAPPDFTAAAFDELCPAGASGCTADFTVGATRAEEFAAVLDAGERPRATIAFTLAEGDAGADLGLVLSTLYATHDAVGAFTLRVELVRVG